MFNTEFFKFTRKSPAPLVSAILGVAALVGTPVNIINTGTASGGHADNTTCEVANGKKGSLYFTNREVINATEIPLTSVIFGNEEVNPVLVTQPVALFQALEIEVEGGDTDADGKATYIKTASTGAISSGTAQDTLLTLVAGQWALITAVATQPVCGVLKKQLTPVTAGNVRLLIEPVQFAYLDTVV